MAASPARQFRATPRSPAERANLQVNDVILEFNGIRVEQDMHLIGLVQLTQVGSRVPLSVLRGGKLMRVDVEIADASGYRDIEVPQQ